MFVFVNVIVIDIISPAKHEDWEGVTTTRMGESASWDIVGLKQCSQVSGEYQGATQSDALGVVQEDGGSEERKISRTDRWMQ